VVVGARVQAVGPVTRAATTNRDGIYRFTGLSEGTYDMTVTATDYNQGTATGVVVVEGQTTTQDFVLSGVGILEGTVMSAANDPIAGARVQAMGPVTRTTMTDNKGFYRLRLPVGTYGMTVTAFAYNPGTATPDVVDGMTTTQNFTLTLAPSHSVSGTVADSVIGTPIQGATVTILNTPIPPATTDANGMYLFPSVPEGTYDMRASARGYSPSTRTGIVVDQDVVVDFALDATVAPCNPDGIDIPSECDSVSGNLVANCGFETGNYPPWVRSGDQSFTSIDASSAHSGNFGLDTGPVGGLGFFAQNLATMPGARYNLSFWLDNEGGPANRVQVSWGGTVIFDSSDFSPFPYRQYCWVGTAPSDSTELKFGFLQVPSFFHFDDVVVTPQ
jgi:carboxypeptidase family protein